MYRDSLTLPLKIINKKTKKNKVNFDYIKMNNYEASAEDLKYYKNIFENSFIEKNSLMNLNREDIKKFILEIS